MTDAEKMKLAVRILDDRNWIPGVHLVTQLEDRMTLTRVALGEDCGHSNDDGRGCATCAEMRARLPKVFTDPTIDP